MKISRIFKAWFGYLAVKGAADVWADRTAAAGAQSRLGGYPIGQVRGLISQWYRARPDIEAECCKMDNDTRHRYFAGFLQLSPKRWAEIFGFEKPAPTS